MNSIPYHSQQCTAPYQKPLPPQQSNGTLPHPSQNKAPPPKPKPTSKIDPSQIPRPTTLQSHKSFKSTLPPITAPPPPPNTRISYLDNSNATPSIIRPTSYLFPSQRTTQEKTGLPDAIFLTPLGDHPSSIPLFDAQSIIRCKNCNVYIHPSCNHNTNEWMCSFCNTTNYIQNY